VPLAILFILYRLIGVEIVPDKVAALTEPTASNAVLINKVLAKKRVGNKEFADRIKLTNGISKNLQFIY
jgi:hypothetical protein